MPQPVPVGPKSRFAHLPRILVRAAILFVPAVLLVTFGTVKLIRHHQAAEQAMLAPIAVPMQPNWENSMDLAASSLAKRPVFPYSIVPGGVADRAELKTAVAADPIVARHYADFHLAQTRTIRLDHSVAMYVSYRRNNNVYWTKSPVNIPAGETLLSDGENLARTRCGNRLSPVAAKPVAEVEPAKEELEAPEFLPPLLAQLLPGEDGEFFPGVPGTSGVPGSPTGGPIGNRAPGLPELPPSLTPGVPPFVPNSSTTPPTPPTPPVNTPEPGVLSLVLAASLAASLLALLRK